MIVAKTIILDSASAFRAILDTSTGSDTILVDLENTARVADSSLSSIIYYDSETGCNVKTKSVVTHSGNDILTRVICLNLPIDSRSFCEQTHVRNIFTFYVVVPLRLDNVDLAYGLFNKIREVRDYVMGTAPMSNSFHPKFVTLFNTIMHSTNCLPDIIVVDRLARGGCATLVEMLFGDYDGDVYFYHDDIVEGELCDQ